MAEKIDTEELLREVDPASVSFRYNAVADTLFIYLGERGIPATSIEVADGVYARWDPAGKRYVALQLENFIRVMVPRFPELLQFADLFGIEPKDIEAARPRAARRWYLFRPRITWKSNQAPDSPQTRQSAFGTLQPLFG